MCSTITHAAHFPGTRVPSGGQESTKEAGQKHGIALVYAWLGHKGDPPSCPCCITAARLKYNVQVLQLLYDADVIEEDAFFKWAEEKAHADEEDRLFLTKAAEFITWLKEAEEEEEEGSGEEEDDDDDS